MDIMAMAGAISVGAAVSEAILTEINMAEILAETHTEEEEDLEHRDPVSIC